MRSNQRLILLLLCTFFTLSFTTWSNAQSNQCEPKPEITSIEKSDDVNSNSESTSGCAPSSCRGAQTKFGEAKVISSLRANLVQLKTAMEKSNSPKFNSRSYDIHGIVGDSDEESLQIIIREVQLIEKEFSNKTNFKPLKFTLPKSKAKQISYLNNRLSEVQTFLK